MIQNTVLILWLVLSKRPQLQVVYISFSYIFLNLLWLVSNICHGFCCSDFRELTCSITHWIVVIIAPLWSFMTRIVAPFTGLLTATRPFFPAERITWPVQWGTKKSSKATTGWNIKFYFQNSNAQMSLEIQEQVLPVSIFTEQSDVAELYYHTLIPAKQIKCKYTTFCSPLSPLAEYWMAEIATWWGCSFISISVEVSRKILTVPSLYPPARYVLSALEKGLQHTQSQAWWRHETNAWAAY